MRKTNTQKTAKFHKALSLTIHMMIGAVIGYFIGEQVSKTGLFDLPLPQILLAYGLLVLGVSLLLILVTILHEMGHLVFGLLTGYRFVSFRVGSLMWIKQEGRLRCRRLTLAGTGGQCLMAPPPMVDGRYPVVLYNLGGAIMNLVSVPLFIGLWVLLSFNPWAALLMALGAALSLGFALFNAIPLKTRLLSNDGQNTIELRKNQAAMRAFWLQLTINARLAEGARLKDLPGDWFAVPSDEDMQNGIVAAIGVIAANRLMDEHRFMEAEQLMARLKNMPSAIAGLHRGLMACDRIYCELMGENRPELINSMLSPQQVKFMKAMGKFISVARTQYALALLHGKDQTAADGWKARFERIARSSPYPGDTQGEGELIALAAQRGAGN
ncbi:MAG: hypothetical protein GXZ04_05170 [Clostridiales bacterium]|nr:hypothetical protein [Clostridiales bacterium]